MEKGALIVRELQREDMGRIANYWLQAEPEYLRSLGADSALLPARGDLLAAMETQLELPYHRKQSYPLIWELDGSPIGHSNLTPIRFGSDAYLHVHLWEKFHRRAGLGSRFIRMSLHHYFKNMELERMYCEPYSENDAPNKVLERLGFTFVRTHITTPGSITFEQPANLWVLTREDCCKASIAVL